MSPLHQRLKALLAKLDAGAEADPALLESLTAEVNRLAPTLPRSELERIAVLYAAITERVTSELEGIRAELRRANTGKRALRGYGHLRSQHLAQRVNTRA